MFLLLLLLFSLMGYSDCSDTIDHQMTLFNLYKNLSQKMQNFKCLQQNIVWPLLLYTSLNIMQNLDLKHTTVNFKYVNNFNISADSSSREPYENTV